MSTEEITIRSAHSGQWRILGRGGRLLSGYAIALLFLLMFISLSFLSPQFFTERNLLNILTQNATVGIIACGMALVIISGGFDLSVGATFAISGISAAYAAQAMPVVPALFVGVGVGLAIGIANGVGIVLFGVNSFIATLATGLMIRGFSLAWTEGFNIPVRDEGFLRLGNDSIGPIPITGLIMGIVVIVFSLIMSRSRFGRHVYAAGGNPKAARMAGVRVDRVRLLAFAISGICAGLAGVIQASRVGAGQPDAGNGIELIVIAAVVVGGISIMGGEGTIPRAILGVFFIALIGNGFNLLNLNTFYQSIVQGLIILIAVAADTRSGGVVHSYFDRIRRGLASRRSR
ncbi:ABC transporter permease [Salinibacterium sp. ZJ454]|uniref:ABC transporter permease n=1 Tax=Salinibacterium sp. ZJ454 TaxID=2708339 RepID=UPI001421DED7|nr:ABC transporter permease [Salinibacterium sp. ZJ454]